MKFTHTIRFHVNEPVGESGQQIADNRRMDTEWAEVALANLLWCHRRWQI